MNIFFEAIQLILALEFNLGSIFKSKSMLESSFIIIDGNAYRGFSSSADLSRCFAGPY
jgi:hypothetical protein